MVYARFHICVLHIKRNNLSLTNYLKINLQFLIDLPKNHVTKYGFARNKVILNNAYMLTIPTWIKIFYHLSNSHLIFLRFESEISGLALLRDLSLVSSENRVMLFVLASLGSDSTKSRP